jgi:DNA-binding NarL/FixJ family response regulator
MTLVHVQESSRPCLRIALISDNHALRMGLKMTLKVHPFMTIITDDVSAGTNAVDIVVRDNPQVIIIDLELSDADPLTLIRGLRSAAADSHILVLSGLDDAKLTREALAAGAEGVMLTIQPPAVLFAAIESLPGFVPCPMGDRPAQSADNLMGDRPSSKSYEPTRQGLIESLTPREWEIIRLIAKGFKNKEISGRLCIAETTVRHHLTSIYSKLHVSTRQKLLIMAHQRGFLELGAG